MKLRFIDRVVLALYALAGLLTLFGGVLYFVAHGRLTSFANALRADILTRPVLVVALIFIALVVLIWTIWVLVIALRREPRYDRGSVSIQNTDHGAVRVSVTAMDTLVKQAIGHVEGVVDLHTHILNHEDSITVRIDMTLASNVHIPNVTMLLQRSIKSFIEEFSGIAVREVEIMVSDVVPVERGAQSDLKAGKSHAGSVVVVPETQALPESQDLEDDRFAEPEEIEPEAEVFEEIDADASEAYEDEEMPARESVPEEARGEDEAQNRNT